MPGTLRCVTLATARSCGIRSGRLWSDRRNASARALAWYVLHYAYGMHHTSIAEACGFSTHPVLAALYLVRGQVIDAEPATMERLFAIAAHLGISKDALLPASRRVAA